MWLGTLYFGATLPLSADKVATYFRRTKPDKVKPLLDTLAALALLRVTEEGMYVG